MKSIFAIIAAATVCSLGGCTGDEAPPSTDGLNQATQPAPSGQAKLPIRKADSQSPVSTGSPPSQVVADAGTETGAMALYRQAQSLMKAGEHEEGYATAKKAMAEFIAEDNTLAWMLLESIPLKERRVDVHFNMGPAERNLPENGIVKPLSFRVWSTGDDESLLEILDFEIGRVNGESLTAAIGKSERMRHANFGILPTDASYEKIKTAVMKVVNRNADQ